MRSTRLALLILQLNDHDRSLHICIFHNFNVCTFKCIHKYLPLGISSLEYILWNILPCADKQYMLHIVISNHHRFFPAIVYNALENESIKELQLLRKLKNSLLIGNDIYYIKVKAFCGTSASSLQLFHGITHDSSSHIYFKYFSPYDNRLFSLFPYYMLLHTQGCTKVALQKGSQDCTFTEDTHTRKKCSFNIFHDRNSVKFKKHSSWFTTPASASSHFLCRFYLRPKLKFYERADLLRFFCFYIHDSFIKFAFIHPLFPNISCCCVFPKKASIKG